MSRFSTTRRVEFADTDMGGIVHFSRYFVFMETAEHQFLEALGTSVALEHEGQALGWPRVAVSCEYRQPARFGDVLDIELDVERRGEKSVTYALRVLCRGRLLASGKTTAVCCVMENGGRPRAIPIPQAVARLIDGEG
jgi:4-hydroxybenzoyl-CoA thioesterase/acyl-CoA thioester hydrolase